jgi:hypothetical protein
LRVTQGLHRHRYRNYHQCRVVHNYNFHHLWWHLSYCSMLTYPCNPKNHMFHHP